MFLLFWLKFRERKEELAGQNINSCEESGISGLGSFTTSSKAQTNFGKDQSGVWKDSPGEVEQ